MTPVELNYELLRRLARYSHTSAEPEEVERLMTHPALDWGVFLGVCFKQKIAGLAALNFRRWRLIDKLPFVTHLALKLFFLANRERNTRMLALQDTIATALHSHGVDARPLKGSILVPLIYKDLGSRVLSDFDYFVSSSKRGEVRAALKSIGFVMGEYDAITGTIRPLEREEELVWQLKMFCMPEFMKVSEDEYEDIVSVDFDFGLHFGETEDPSVLLLAKHGVIAGRKTLAVDDFFIQLCCHLYKEASNESWIGCGLDVNIVKFCDVREYALAMFSSAALPALRMRILELKSENAVYFSVFHAFEIYRDALLGELLEILSRDLASADFMVALYRQGTKVVGIREKTIAQLIGSL